MASASDEPYRSKRLKVSTACDECRRKKIKCDEDNPACSNCRKSFGNAAASRCQKTLHDPSHPRPTTRGSRQQSRSLGQASSVSVSAAPPLSQNAPLRPRRAHSTSQGQAENGTGSAALGLVDHESLSTTHFGGSSVRSFLQRIQAMIQSDAETVTTPPSLNINSWFHNYLYGPSQSVAVAMDKHVLSKPLADDLMTTYWDRIHPLYPFLDRTQVDLDYTSLWTGSRTVCDGSTIRCTVYTLLALACQVSASTPPSEREELSAKLYGQALLHFDPNGPASVASVQNYLLRAQYVQSTDDHQQFWLLCGTAARIAFSIGMHLARPSERAPDEKFRQLLRRVWHGCVLLDRIAALTFGRPILIHECEVPLPDALSPADLSEHNESTDLQISPLLQANVTVFVETAKLFRIFHDALAGIYPFHTPTSKMEDLLGYLSASRPSPPTGRLVLSLDFELVEWRKNLPEHLRSDIGLSREHTILQQRYLFLKIVSLRPILAAYIHTQMAPRRSRPAIDLLGVRYARQSCLLCVELVCMTVSEHFAKSRGPIRGLIPTLANLYSTTHQAQNSIDLIFDQIADTTTNESFLSEWWYNVLYAYVSATILVAARLLIHASTVEETHMSGIDESWQKALQIMQSYETYRSNISRLKKTLEVLWSGLPTRYQELQKRREAASQLAARLDHSESAAPGLDPRELFTSSGLDKDVITEPLDLYSAGQSIYTNPGQDDVQQADWAVFDTDLGDMSWLNDLPTLEEY